MASHRHQASASLTFMEVVEPSTRGSKRASTKRVWKERWERRIEKDWQGNFDTLRQCVSELLVKNQHLRMEKLGDKGIHE